MGGFYPGFGLNTLIKITLLIVGADWRTLFWLEVFALYLYQKEITSSHLSSGLGLVHLARMMQWFDFHASEWSGRECRTSSVSKHTFRINIYLTAQCIIKLPCNFLQYSVSMMIGSFFKIHIIGFLVSFLALNILSPLLAAL